MLAVKKLKQKQSRVWVRSFSTTKLSIPSLQSPGSSETLPYSLGLIVSLSSLTFLCGDVSNHRSLGGYFVDEAKGCGQSCNAP